MRYLLVKESEISGQMDTTYKPRVPDGRIILTESEAKALDDFSAMFFSASSLKALIEDEKTNGTSDYYTDESDTAGSSSAGTTDTAASDSAGTSEDNAGGVDTTGDSGTEAAEATGTEQPSVDDSQEVTAGEADGGTDETADTEVEL